MEDALKVMCPLTEGAVKLIYLLSLSSSRLHNSASYLLQQTPRLFQHSMAVDHSVVQVGWRLSAAITRVIYSSQVAFWLSSLTELYSGFDLQLVVKVLTFCNDWIAPTLHGTAVFRDSVWSAPVLASDWRLYLLIKKCTNGNVTGVYSQL